MKIAIVDYGLANIQSVINAIECFGVESYVANRSDELVLADRIVLPGVGAFDAGMKGLHEQGFVDVLNDLVLKKQVPCLGICLGFQFLFEGSDEGEATGLGWIKGRAEKFDTNIVKVPHMGWNEVVLKEDSKLMSGLSTPSDFYFVHSYCVPFSDEAADCSVAYCEYGQKYVAAVEKDHIFGVQFHPEKSQLAGMKLLENFISYE